MSAGTKPHSCPHCGQPLPGGEADQQREVEALAAALRAAGHLVTPDLRVREHVAAELLARSPLTLRNWAATGAGRLESVKVAGRRTYRLAEVHALMKSANRTEPNGTDQHSRRTPR